MEPIKTIAGKILLYFYSIQRIDYAKLHDLMLAFQMRHFSNPNEHSPKMERGNNEVIENLLKISNNDNDIYNALKYLQGGGFIEMSDSKDNVGDHFLNFNVTNYGIDIIEGIERGDEEKRVFNINFNIKVADTVNIESLLKAEVGSLIKTSLL